MQNHCKYWCLLPRCESFKEYHYRPNWLINAPHVDVGTGGRKRREGGRDEAKVEGTTERKRLEKIYGDLTEHVTWREKSEAHTHTHARAHAWGKNTNTLPGRVIFSDPHFTVSPANNPYNLTIPRNLTDQSITPSNRGAILRSEMKHIKAQVWVCVHLAVCTPLPHPPPPSPPPPPYFLSSSTELPDCGMIQQKCKAPWMDKMAGVVFLPPLRDALWRHSPLYSWFLPFFPPSLVLCSTSLHPHTFSVSVPLSSPPPLFLPRNRKNSGVNSSPEFIQNYDSVC